MTSRAKFLVSMGLILCVGVLTTAGGARAATKTLDLDGNTANGAESQCDTNVLQTFPVMIENKVTNRSGNAFDFSWPSAGPGGFTSSVPIGTTGGRGSTWVWTTNQSVFGFTGNSCSSDLCLSKTTGPDVLPGTCSLCRDDGVAVSVAKGTTAGETIMSWQGGQAAFTIYRSTNARTISDASSLLATTDLLTYSDVPPSGTIFFYQVRASSCLVRNTCSTDADCTPAQDGVCVNRGPFGVPGRSIYASNVTVSAGSLTSSLITFFSPPKEIFWARSTAGGGGVATTLTNSGTSPVTVVTPAYPEGCCPAVPGVPHQLRCGEACVDYLNDPANCGACNNACQDGTCCSNGGCVSVCGVGQVWCDGLCADVQNDNGNCGGCGTICGDGACCNGGSCVSLCDENRDWCDNACADLQNDSAHCGTCGSGCSDGTCCNGGSCASVCGADRIWCNEQCVDLQNDSANCGTCGTTCGDGTCCINGTCESFCPAGQVLCGTQCVDFDNDSANCGSCGLACGDGTCCNNGTCESFCNEGQVWCNGQCVDLRNDSANCGTCGTTCGDGTCCNVGTCESFCPTGQVLCGTECVDFDNDSANCGACGHACGDGTCCSVGDCVSVCGENQVWCNNACVDLYDDNANCGACGNSCDDGFCCGAGVCVSGCPPGLTYCNGMCVDLQGDPQNCGSCGTVCGQNGFNDNNACEHGQCWHDALHDALLDPLPIPVICPNPIPPGPGPGTCPNPSPTAPTPGSCRNETPSHPVAGSCHNGTPSDPTPAQCRNESPAHPLPGQCPNETSAPPVPGHCPNTHPSVGPVAGVCPASGRTATRPDETPLCLVEATTETIPPGGSATTCTPGGVVFKEVATPLVVCGDGIPGVNGLCNNGTSKVTTGTFNRFVPDLSVLIGNAYVTPLSVRVVSDTSNDGLIEPGETVGLLIDVLNSGLMNITDATGVLSAPSIDLTADGVVNPVGVTVGSGPTSYGTIVGTPVASNCTAPPPQPASNAAAFSITVPPSHPGDTSHPLMLAIEGTVNGGPFAMSVPLTVGIADTCDPSANSRDYDGLDGLSSPMAKLVPLGDPVPFPSRTFSAGTTRPLKLRLSCGSVNLDDHAVDPPEIVGLSEATRGELDIDALNLNSDDGSNPNDPLFRFNNVLTGGGQWTYNVRTALIGTGSFTLRIRIAGRKVYSTGFVLR